MKLLRTALRVWLLGLCATAATAADKVLYVYNWSEYMPEAVLEQFEDETGIEVVYATFDSNEAMYAKLRLVDDKNSYDVAVPSTYYVSKMRREGLLAPIDKSRLKNFKYLDTKLVNQPFDPDNQYSVPYLWGSTGIAVNTDTVKPDALSKWADLWKPEFKDRLMMTNDMREVFHVGLRVLGYSGNDTDAAHLEAAYEKLKDLMPNVRVFNSEAPRMPYLEGETDAGMIWNGEAYVAQEENAAIVYIYPEEGVALWMDNLVIPKTARNVDNAHLFIDFLLRPEIGRLISEEIGYASPNAEAVTLLDEEVRSNRTVYPIDADLKNAEFQTDVGDAITVYEKYWELLKAGRD
ncbi:MAG: extracellular solute-binding protein [Gammaproteobacteria bacterium]|nr:MAG: extracellular solute-binding protein [Gammaproteobacteria bacterium]